MPELEWVPALIVFMIAGALLGEVARGLPRLWQWLRFKVWWDYRYSAGYRKGLAHGRSIARRDDSE